MEIPEKDPEPEEPELPAATFPEETVLPEGYTPIGDLANLPRARRRRAQRMLVPPGEDERATLLDDLARRAFPSIEFFLFALLCGLILGLAFLLDSPALLLLGILVAPLLTPWVGLVLAAVTGSWRFFFQTLGGFLVAGLLVFLFGMLAGLAGSLGHAFPLFHANIHSHLWWPDLLVVTLGAVLLAIAFVRSEQRPFLPSALLAYGFFLPLSAAGIGLSAGDARLWPNGLMVFIVHLLLAVVTGGITLAAMRFRPKRLAGFLLPAVLGSISLVVLVVFTGLVGLIRDGITAARHLAPTPATFALPSSSPTVFRTRTQTPSITPSATVSLTPTLEPTPAYASITSSAGGGALLRTEPGSGTPITTISNGILVQVLPEIESVNGVTWVHIRTLNNIEGWVLQSVLAATRQTPVFTPTFTLTATSTPTP